jgi:hypothetical protein
MDLVTALAVVIGVLAAIATWVAVTVGSPYLLIWAIFLGWASFFHCGGKEAGLKNSAIANVWGVVCAAVALVAALALGITAITTGICVGITVAIMILGAKVPALAAIPAGLYGYAATAALFLLVVFPGGIAYGAGAGAVVKVAVAVAISMIIGNVLGYVSEKIAGALLKS